MPDWSNGRIAVRRLYTAAMAVALLAGAATPARADGFFTPFYGYNFGGDSSANCQTLRRLRGQAREFRRVLRCDGHAWSGSRKTSAFAKDFFGSVPNVDNSVFTAMSNLLIGVGKGPIQPYVLIGAGLIRTQTSLNPLAVQRRRELAGVRRRRRRQRLLQQARRHPRRRASPPYAPGCPVHSRSRAAASS